MWTSIVRSKTTVSGMTKATNSERLNTRPGTVFRFPGDFRFGG
jgi:hypothetical protein